MLTILMPTNILNAVDLKEKKIYRRSINRLNMDRPMPIVTCAVLQGNKILLKAGQWSDWLAGCLLRSYGLDAASGSGRRSLFNLSARYGLSPNWKLRGAWVTAWGDPVDLVSAIVPVTGMVLPRHWGAWRSEMVLGGEWRHRRARVQAAGSWRQPEARDQLPAVLTLWLEAGIRW